MLWLRPLQLKFRISITGVPSSEKATITKCIYSWILLVLKCCCEGDILDICAMLKMFIQYKTLASKIMSQITLFSIGAIVISKKAGVSNYYLRRKLTLQNLFKSLQWESLLRIHEFQKLLYYLSTSCFLCKNSLTFSHKSPEIKSKNDTIYLI